MVAFVSDHRQAAADRIRNIALTLTMLLTGATAALPARADAPLLADDVAATAAPASADAPSAAQLITIRPSRLRCVRAPCPSWVLFSVGEDGSPLNKPLRLARERLPRFEGSADNLAQLETAIRAEECLMVEGRLEERAGSPLPDRVLHVERIAGACKPRPQAR